METKIKELLAQNNYKCNADGRKFIYEQVGAQKPNKLKLGEWMSILMSVNADFSCTPETSYPYVNAQGFLSFIDVCGLRNLPENMENPYLVCFSGIMTAHIYTFEVLRGYAQKHNQVLPLLCIGKGGNKGLYENVYNRQKGIMIGSEANAYLNCFEYLAPKEWVRANEIDCQDTDTAGNFDELYEFAKKQGRPTTFILCSGNFSYEKRVLAEFMLKAKDCKYSDVEMRFILVHCPPAWNKFHVVDGRLSEILLGYIAASIGPMLKDTISFDGKTTSTNPERYLMPELKNVDWNKYEDIISNYSNMGWPNYAEMLYGLEHKDAVERIIMSDLRARGSFSPSSYDVELMADLYEYKQFLGEYSGEDFLTYLQNTPRYSYFK